MNKIKLISLLLALLLSYSISANDDVKSESFDDSGVEDARSMDDLLKQSLEKLMQIEVVSKQKENKNSAAGIVSVVTRRDIERYGANNLADVLNRVTSVYMLSTSLWHSGVASMRGDAFTPINNHTLVLINGRPVRDGLNGGINSFVFRNFPIHAIQQIEVIRGSGSVLYGTNAFSAVINIVTQKRQDNKMVVRGRYGSFDTGQVESEFAWKNDQASITGAVRHRANKGWLMSLKDGLGMNHQFRTDEDDTSGSFSGEWGDFTLNGFVSESHYNDIGGVLVKIANSSLNSNRVFLDVGHKKQLNPQWLVQTNVTYNRLDFDFLKKGVVDSHGHEDSLLIENTHFLNFFDKKLNVLIGGLAELQTAPDPSYQHLRASLYSEINYALLDNLKVTAGGQWNHFQHLENSPSQATVADKTVDGFVKRFGVVYDITPRFGAKLLYSEAFRSASAFELDASDIALEGNRNLQPERIETFDAQVFYHSKDYEASLTAFRSRQSNLIVRKPIPKSSLLKIVNGGSAVFKGLELETKAKLVDGLQWTGAYTFQTNYDGNKQNNITPVPNHLMKIGLSYDVNKDLQVGVFDTFTSAAKVVPAAPLVNPPAKAYHNISLNTRYQLNNLLGLPYTKQITFSFFVDNLLDVKAYYPEINRKTVINTIPANSGRSLFGEIAIEF